MEINMKATNKKLPLLFSSLNRRFGAYGQISSHNEVGRWIKMISSLESVKSIVEVGTWNGKGSSKCIAEGVLQRANTNCHVVGFEVNPKMFSKAKRNLSRFGFFEVVFGSVVSEEHLDRVGLSEQELEWFIQDVEWIRAAPFSLDRVPREIDLLILDGGEFSTYAEFKQLEGRLNSWLILDDTRTRKCSKILSELEKNSNYRIIYSSHERNGTAVVLKLS
jgi:predicted O-methyltransferase YrrM